MLVVTRKAQESILIGDEIRVEVVELRAGRLKLGIDAPKWMSIQREELVDPDDSPPPIVHTDRGDAA